MSMEEGGLINHAKGENVCLERSLVKQYQPSKHFFMMVLITKKSTGQVGQAFQRVQLTFLEVESKAAVHGS